MVLSDLICIQICLLGVMLFLKERLSLYLSTVLYTVERLIWEEFGAGRETQTIVTS